MKKAVIVLILLTLLLASIFSISITALDDPLSKNLRAKTETSINSYVENLTDKAFSGSLSFFDQAVLNISVLSGVAYTRFTFPEASALLYHYVYGNGSDLMLDSTYFQASDYLNQTITTLGLGEHGPIAFKQNQDWRLSLALNPYYLNISNERVRLFHPKITFAPLSEKDKTFTIVPIGKMKLKIYDNLISAMNPRPFYVYSEWPASF